LDDDELARTITEDVLVIEEGKRWRTQDFPTSNWNVRKSLWLPRLGCHGIQRLDWLGDVLVLGGAGVGGGLWCMPTRSSYRLPRHSVRDGRTGPARARRWLRTT
jgi:hypothetical protein